MNSTRDSCLAMAETTKNYVPLVCPGHSRPVVQVSYSNVTPDGVFIVSACLDAKPMLRRADTGDWVGTFEGHKGAVWTIALDQPAMRAATGSADWSAKLWDAITGDELATFKNAHVVKSVQFSNDGKQLLCAGNEKKMRLFDLGSPEADPIFLQGHTAGVRSALFLRNGENTIVSGAQDKTVRIWDTRKPDAEATVINLDAQVVAMEQAYDGSVISIAMDNNSVAFWDTASHSIIKTVPLEGVKELSSVSLHPSKSRFICGDVTPWVHIFDYETGKEVELNKGHHGRIWDVTFHPDGESYSSAADDATVRIWQSAAKAEEAGKLSAANAPPTAGQ